MDIFQRPVDNSVDIELCKVIRKEIATNPASHDQRTWAHAADESCGTTMCIAGHTVHHSGYDLVYFTSLDSYGYQRTHGVYADYCCDEEGNTYHIDDLAQKLLGIDFDEAERVFHDTNNDRALDAFDGLISYYDGDK